ncbi:FemAB family protein [Arthrobacter sp. MYb211]|uniref:lipid II:glycine glycyltransferase FemX n=1 Tax=unclassified Arthrobacter TaxID=235627 RepID=UPI000CFDEE88|nr:MULTISPECIES: peptidoglycan bridge formation glycyltransferase FemA/FemB family protein [unclassified Arthrobacter]PRA12218.1 FemAB family protein [Arthrobacter sp. MYb221]PRC08680.1 FemAB family protein [Arthrobacter sp. MYb211]
MSHNELRVRPISSTEHSAFLATAQDVSFLQRPEWAQVKGGWRGESLGWFESDTLVGVALVLHRHAPVIKKTLAYIPDGPVIDFTTYDPQGVLSILASYLKNRGAFQLRLGPGLAMRTWGAAAVRKAFGKEELASLADLETVSVNEEAHKLNEALGDLGFTKQDVGMDFAAGQPEYVARVVLQDAEGNQLDTEQVMASYSSSTRNETRKSLKSELKVEIGETQDMARFHALYNHTAERQEFTGRPLSYFEKMHTVLNAAVPGSCTLYIASHEGVDLASAIVLRSSNLAWYLYGASSSEQRKLFAPKALMHHMISDSTEAGCRYLDQGGVSATLDSAHHLAGLTKFKTNTGCDIVQTNGEWDLALNKPLAWAFEKYMNWRQK